MVIGKLAIDTGYESAAVYAWARAQGFDQVCPIKGLEGFNRATPVSGPTFVDASGRNDREGPPLWSGRKSPLIAASSDCRVIGHSLPSHSLPGRRFSKAKSAEYPY
jgi:hypothetical protein